MLVGVLVLGVLLLIRGVAVAIPLLGGLVMVGMGVRCLGQIRRQSRCHEQDQGDQPTAEQSGIHNGKRRPRNKSGRRWPDRIDGWAVVR